jgi:hypothetical protein
LVVIVIVVVGAAVWKKQQDGTAAGGAAGGGGIYGDSGGMSFGQKVSEHVDDSGVKRISIKAPGAS